MKNYSPSLVKIFLISFLIITPSIIKVSATVGGEIFIYNFNYNTKDESVYYIQHDLGGRGCPPILAKVSLSSEKSSIVYSCSQAEEIPRTQLDGEINKIIKDFKPLVPLDLKKNNILIYVKFLKAETYGSESNEILMRHFTVELYQNNKKIKEFPITGCNLEQPFIFQGYSIPGFDKKIVLLLSSKGNCAEGGYIYESLHIIGGVDNLDKTPSTNFYKGPSALIPNEGNLVVYESQKIILPQELNTNGTTNVSTTSTSMEESPKKSFFKRLIEWFMNLF